MTEQLTLSLSLGQRLGQSGNAAQLWMCQVVKVKSDAIKKKTAQEPGMLVRSMNQGKLGVVKQEMARVSINTLGISELKWMGMGEFNSNNHYIYYCWQESLRRNGTALSVNKKI